MSNDTVTVPMTRGELPGGPAITRDTTIRLPVRAQRPLSLWRRLLSWGFAIAAKGGKR